MKILVLEPHAIGHHGPYLEWMVNGLVERGFEVTVVTLPESIAHPTMQSLADAAPTGGSKSLRLISFPAAGFPRTWSDGTAGFATRELSYWRLFKAQAGTVRPDVVFLPYLDYCLYAIGLLGSPFGNCPWVGLAMRPSFHYRQMGVIAPRPSLAAIKRALFFRLLNNRHLRSLLTIDEPLATYLADRARVSGKVAFFPEPTEFGELLDTSDAKRKLGVPADRNLILVYGAITRRKGVVELLRAVVDPELPPSVDVLLAGKVSPEIHELLVEPWVAKLVARGRIRLFDRFIETKEEPVLFAAADVVWLGYRGHYNASGALVLAAAASCPVIACEEGIIGWQTQRHGLGRTVNPEDMSEVAAAVGALLDYPPVKTENNGRADPWRPASFSEAQDALAHVLVGA